MIVTVLAVIGGVTVYAVVIVLILGVSELVMRAFDWHARRPLERIYREPALEPVRDRRVA